MYPDPIATDPITAEQVARGTLRLLYAMGWVGLREVSLANGRRADIQALGPGGRIAIVEIKVSIADLRGDGKWPDYLPWCDRFFWAVPPGFPLAPFADHERGAGRAGLIVADAFGGVVVTDAAEIPLAPARRKAETARFAARAALRVMAAADPGLGATEFA